MFSKDKLDRSIELRKQSEAPHAAWVAAKTRLQEMVLAANDIDIVELHRLRKEYLTNLAKCQEITRQLEAIRKEDILERNRVRDARRAEAAGWSKPVLVAKTGVDGKRHTRTQLVEMYAQMAG